MTRGLAIAKLSLACACLAPLVWLFFRAAEVGSLTLGANPVEEVLNVCGKTGLNLLILTLCVTPIRRSTGINRLIAFRRMLGLFSFFYLSLHFSTYVALDLGFAWDTLAVDIAERPYITVGFTALVLMVPLAITSTNALQRRLGRNWIKLHRLVYPIGVLGVVHYWWQTKLDVAEPLLYAFVLAVLLGSRLAHSRELRRKRSRSVDSKPAVAATYQGIEPPETGQKARH